MPTIAPVERDDFEDVTTGGVVVAAAAGLLIMDVGVTVALFGVLVRVGATSLGKYSSGLNSCVAFWL